MTLARAKRRSVKTTKCQSISQIASLFSDVHSVLSLFLSYLVVVTIVEERHSSA